MTVENMEVDVVDTSDVNESNKQDSQQPSQYEVDAREMGWRPKDEWEGDPEKWRDAGRICFRATIAADHASV